MNTVAKIFLISLAIVAGAQAEGPKKKLKPKIAQHDKMRKAYYKSTPQDKIEITKTTHNIALPFATLYENTSKKLKAQNAYDECNDAIDAAEKTGLYKPLLKANRACRYSNSMESKECSKFHELEKEFLATKEGKKLQEKHSQFLPTFLLMCGSLLANEYTYGSLHYDTRTAMQAGINLALGVDNRGYNPGLGVDNGVYSIGHTAEIYKKARAGLEKMADDICYEK